MLSRALLSLFSSRFQEKMDLVLGQRMLAVTGNAGQWGR